MTVIDSKNGGWLKVVPEHKDCDAHLYVQTSGNGTSLDVTGVREAIILLAEQAGFKSEPTGDGMGVIIQFPESEAVQARREELAYKFMDTSYEEAVPSVQHAIEYIIDGEKKRGELK